MMSSGAGPSRPPRYAWKKNPVFQFLASLRLAVSLLSVLIVMSIVGTLAESKFDADTARTWIYEAPWFHLWLLFLGANLTCSALMRWPWRKYHTGFLLTHLGIIIVMVGAVVGQIWGIEGTMTLFKQSAPDNQLVLQKRQITIRDPDAQRAVMIQLGRQPLRVREGRALDLWTTPGGWKLQAVADSPRLVADFRPTPAPSGAPAVLIRLHTKAMNQTVEQWLLAGDQDHARLDLGLITVDLARADTAPPATGAANRAIITAQPGGTLQLELFAAGQRVSTAPLAAGQAVVTVWNDWTIEAREILPSAQAGFHFEPLPKGAPIPPGRALLDGIKVRATNGGRTLEQWVGAGWRVSLPTGTFPVEIAYGWEVARLPFGLVLDNFTVERNEGTDEPASFRSDLSMVLPDGKTDQTGSCSMNQPANYPQALWRSLTGLTYKISQASWNPNDLTQSSVQILRDPGWFFKWTGSLILCAGLVTMFIFRRPASTIAAPHDRRAVSLVSAILLLAAAAPSPAQLHQGRKLVEASLLADTTAIVPGQPFRLGLHLRMAPGWHTYWENPGDSGLATTFDPQLPEGLTAGPITWPLPKRLVEPGDIQVYAYKGEVLLVRTITPADAIDAAEITIPAKSSWLVCEEICIPGKADVQLTLPVAASAAPANADLFAKFTALTPSTDGPPCKITWTPTPTGWSLGLRDAAGVKRADFYPFADDQHPVGHTAARDLIDGAADLAIPVTGSAPVRGVIVLENGDRRGWIIDSTAAAPSATADRKSSAKSGLWTYLLFGFIGGFILNLMPCVLPVISLKIFGFMRQAGDSRASIFQHGLAFTAGIFLWFLGLAAVIIALKAAGSEVTWAFQFQNPWFNFVIGAAIFLFALNLFGVFEIVLPGRAAQGIAEAGSHGGLAGSFAQGILATLLATPCTAPFLGTALGFAFSQTSTVIAAMFASIAAGMAFPYLLLSAQPGWMKFLPKPGAWMERLKQFMGFPLAATLLWLLYVIGQQRGTEAVIWASAAYLCLALAAWLYGAFLGPVSSGRAKISATIGIIVSLLLGLGYFTGNLFARAAATTPEKSASVPADGMPWVPYAEAELQRLLAAGKPVFVDFTADWCITCKFNMRTAIDTKAVRAAFEKLGIVPMLADWTNSNPEITKKLAQFDRVGVPFYLFYAAGRADDPVILPELLTEQILLRAVGAQP